MDPYSSLEMDSGLFEVKALIEDPICKWIIQFIEGMPEKRSDLGFIIMCSVADFSEQELHIQIIWLLESKGILKKHLSFNIYHKEWEIVFSLSFKGLWCLYLAENQIELKI